MGYSQPGFGVSYKADVDMSTVATFQFAAVWLGAAANVGTGTGNGNATLQTKGAETTPPLGILQNNPIQGEAGSVWITGISQAIYGGTLAVGDLVTANASGAIVAAATGDWVLGRAMESGTAGTIGTVLLQQAAKLAA